MSRFGKVAVLMGGKSSEREVSLMSGKNVLEALLKSGVDAVKFDPAERELFELKREGFDAAFNILHGKGGEDGTIQGALEFLGIPYTGSGVAPSAISMDKWRTKMIWQAMKIPTPGYRVVDEKTDWNELVAELGTPFMLKATCEGSSVGVVKVTETDAASIAKRYAEVAALNETVIAEEFISGMELTAGILNGQALPLIKIVAPNGNYDFDHKYFSEETQYFCPSGIDAAIEKNICADALRAFRLVGCSGWGRLDLMMREDGSYSFLEINTTPGMTAHSLVPRAARTAGISFEELCVKILEGAHVG